MPAPNVESWIIRSMSPDTCSETCPGMVAGVDARFFLQGMMNRMAVSHTKYGSIADKFPHDAVGVSQIIQRLQMYTTDGNVEWLIDVANYALIEALRPSHDKAHFRATDTDESPGRINKDGTVSHGR